MLHFQDSGAVSKSLMIDNISVTYIINATKMRTFSFVTIMVFSAIVCFAQSEELIPGKTFKKKLLKDVSHQYTVHLKKGSYLTLIAVQKGVDLAVDVYSPSGKKLGTFDSPNGAEGPEPVNIDAVESGRYKISIYPLQDPSIPDSMVEKYKENNQGDYAIQDVVILSSLERRKMISAEKEKQQHFINWLSSNAHPLKTVKAGSDFEDLQWLKPVLQNVKYVGLGEATHGTSEFFQMKHRVLEFLTKEMNFNYFAIEASYSGCQNINDYILYGKGDARTALRSQGFWTWDTEEVVDMLEWMRSYNETVSAEKKIHFYGFDIQVNSLGGGIKRLQQYLHKVDSKLDDSVFFKQLEKVDWNPNSDTAIMVQQKLSALLVTMLLRKPYYLLVSSDSEYHQALRYGTVIAQYLDVYLMTKNDKRKKEREWRDFYMAGNFFDLAEKHPDAKVVIWAHNAHINKDDSFIVNQGLKPFGSYLKDIYGNQYFAIGFAFNKGNFQAIESGKWTLEEFTVTNAKKGSLDSSLASVRKGNYIINFSQKEIPAFVQNIISNDLLTRNYGSVGNRKTINESYGNIVLSRAFNSIIFIDSTTRSKPTPN